MIFQPFDPTGRGSKKRRLFDLPLLAIVPSLITLAALAVGLSAVRMALEGRYEIAMAFIIIAAVLDGIDGRIARLLKRTSRFGAELDSLADVVNFGVVPALILYQWGLDALGNFGWMIVVIFACCTMLRLARFNVQLDDKDKPAWKSNFFQGVPSPLAAFLACLPIYIHLSGIELLDPPVLMVPVSFYVLGVGVLMVSSLPVYSGKAKKMRIARGSVIALLILIGFAVWLISTHPWPSAAVLCLLYLCALPYWHYSYRRQDAEHKASQTPEKPKE